ncbi:MAG: UDP-glucose--hexose-1-phosphate uridylyltransferase [Acidimicrobiia bacterium]|nr:UDP-glucose--hexose-1-phosphate uridylyltransferase [Acidimicrobiia bacterium]
MNHTIEVPHRRFNPLTGQWVLVSTGRTQRPWTGQTDAVVASDRPEYDPDCYLCPGNTRAGGVDNPQYDSTFVFTNDFASLNPLTPDVAVSDHPLLQAHSEHGTCRVICFSPRHDLTLANMPAAAVRATVELWASQVEELSASYEWVQVFENRGELMGASNPHPHGQIWAGSALPTLPGLEDSHQLAYTTDTGRLLLSDYLDEELTDGSRIVVDGEAWVVLVPYWAVWPYETMVLPKESIGHLDDTTNAQRDDLAAVLQKLLGRYDALFSRSFPYSMGWHGRHADHWTLHGHFFPPLMGPDRQKFMVGYEMLAEAQRDISAEDAADRLRSVGERT